LLTLDFATAFSHAMTVNVTDNWRARPEAQWSMKTTELRNLKPRTEMVLADVEEKQTKATTSQVWLIQSALAGRAPDSY
jgi:hypothetical protein